MTRGVIQTNRRAVYLADVDLVDCLEEAYETIKDHKGYLTSDGIFVKEE